MPGYGCTYDALCNFS